jgi:hypothetical protein
VADIFRRCGPQYRQSHADGLSRAQRRAMSAIELCRTAALGGHVEQCDACGHQRITYDSCRHRACPRCQSLARAQWLEHRQAELLPGVEYFHVVLKERENDPLEAKLGEATRRIGELVMENEVLCKERQARHPLVNRRSSK